jgi:succinate dehydrogenase / fumarate reductase, cytochrome b subunit
MTTDVRNRGLMTALRYRGREGMWTWLLHRATGLGILLFLVVHVVETAAIIYSPEFYDSALGLYKSPLFRFAELLIFFAVLFHALNGLRIVVQDFWPYVMKRQRQLAWGAALVTAVVMVPVTWIMVAPLFGWAEEPGTQRHIERCLERPEAPACQDGHAGEVGP